MNKQKIIIGMSGGVDSSVAALLLLEQGYEVEGLFMKNWEEDDDEDYCAAAIDLKDASSVCKTLNIKLHTINFSSEYWDRVFQHFLHEYSAGRTPNPDILCNKEIKFRAFLDHALSLGAEKIATGHYVRTRLSNNKTQLLRGKDSNKDQSYFLHTLNQQQLSHSLFPIGDLAKSRVRELAEKNHLKTFAKKDSTGICFIGERRFSTFLEKYLPAKPGEIHSVNGKYIGDHNGLMYYTLGQRKGLGIGGLKESDEDPWYVVEKDLKNNSLKVAQGHNHPAMFHNTLETGQVNWIANAEPDSATMDRELTAKIRYRQNDQNCSLTKIDQGKYKVTFEQTQRAITPGQSVVFYQNEVCLGGGVIEAMYNVAVNNE
ncbi:MAG: tRNA 2-thiouridine(34) synthase MnmA [Gammaproteobacteria bacterium]|nr:tRNA 2-thiouridine(34) synthase MnmA [Gammaproteobacteria bacterium]